MAESKDAALIIAAMQMAVRVTEASARTSLLPKPAEIRALILAEYKVCYAELAASLEAAAGKEN